MTLGRARPHPHGAVAAARAGRRPRPLAHPAAARPPARPHGPRRHRPVARHRPRVQRGPGAGHPAAGDLAVGPPAHGPRLPPQRRRRHRRPRSPRTRSASSSRPGHRRTHPACSIEESQWAAVRRIVEQADPRRIGIDVSETFGLADGLSHTDHRLLVQALGPYADRLVSGRGPRRRLARDPAARGDRRRCTPSTGWRTRSSPRPSPPPSSSPGTHDGARLAWWIRQRFPTSVSTRGSSPTVACSGRASRWSRSGARCCPPSPSAPVIEPGDLVHCDVGLSSLGLCTDTQRYAYVLRPGECDGAGRAADGARMGNRLQDLTTGRAASPGRTGNEVLAAARAAAAAEGIDGGRLLPPHRRPRARRRPGDRAVGRAGAGVPGAGDLVVHAETAYALELAVRVAVPEWAGQCVRMALEEGIALTADGVSVPRRPPDRAAAHPERSRSSAENRPSSDSARGLLLAGLRPSSWCSPSGWRRPAASSSSSSGRRCRASWRASSRWSLVAFASTPPLVFRSVFLPPAAWASDGPFRPPALVSQWSPTFSKLCFTAAHATWFARCSSPYSPAAESCALAKVRCAFFGERCSVLGSSDCLACRSSSSSA